MKLWLVQRDGRKVGYDEYDAWIIAHHTGQDAIESSGYASEPGIDASEVGEAREWFAPGHVVLGSFNAG